MSTDLTRAPHPLSSAVVLSLGLHMAALQFVILPAPAESVPTLAIETRLIARETPPIPPPKSPPVQKQPAAARSQTRPLPAAALPMLSGGAAMGDEDGVTMSRTETQPAAGRLATNHVESSMAGIPRGGAQAAAGGLDAVRETTGSAALPALVSAAPSMAARPVPAAGGGQAEAGELASARALTGALASRVLTSAVASGGAGGSGTRPVAGGSAVSGEAGNSLSSGPVAARAAVLSSATAAAATGTKAGSAAPAFAAPGETHGQRIDLAHAKRADARLADASAQPRSAGSSDRDRGAEPSGPAPAQRHSGPPKTNPRLADAVAVAVDFNALPTTSNRLIKAALAADGESCFRYTSRMLGMRQQGLVVLRVRVNRDGRAEQIELQKGSGNAALDAAALEQAQGCARFVLSDRHGRPVAASVELPIRYQINNEF
jgi:protein TonB